MEQLYSTREKPTNNTKCLVKNIVLNSFPEYAIATWIDGYWKAENGEDISYYVIGWGYLPGETPVPSIPTSEHLKNIKLLQAIYAGKKIYVECFPTDNGALFFPNSNLAVKVIEFPNVKCEDSIPTSDVAELVRALESLVKASPMVNWKSIDTALQSFKTKYPNV